jgi:hypothetical protein
VVAEEESVRLRTTLVLLLIAAGLGAYAYFVELPARQEAAEPQHLLDFDRDAVTTLTLAYPDHEIRLTRDGGAPWRIAAPLDVAADQTAVTHLLNAIADAELTRTIEDAGGNDAEYGFDSPTVTITIGLAEGAPPPPLLVGKQTPIGFKAYARKEGDSNVYLTTGSFHSGVKKEAKDLRDKTVIDFTDDRVETITLVKPDTEPLELRRTDGTWNITAPGTWMADAGEVGGLLSALRGLRAQEFIDDADSDDAYGLDAPRLIVTVSLEGTEDEHSVHIGGDAPGTPEGIYARAGDARTIYKVPSWSLGNLDKDISKLRDRTVLPFDADAVGAVTIASRGTPVVTLRRAEDSTWSVDGSEAAPDEAALSRFASDLRQTKPAAIVSDDAAEFPRYGLDDPDVRITVLARDETPLGTVLAAAQPGATPGAETTYYFAREGAPTVYSGPAYLYTRLYKSLSDFVAAPPSDDAADDAPNDPAPADE